MRITHLTSTVLAIALSAATAAAQLTVIPNTGCRDGVSTGSDVYPIANQQPTIGNVAFGLGYTCPPGATAAFVVWGTCNAGPLIDWDLSATCFNWWTTTPGTCRQVYGTLYPLGGNVARQGKVVWPLPIPNEPALITFTQTTPLCFQFIAVDLDVDPDLCYEVSAGLQLQFM